MSTNTNAAADVAAPAQDAAQQPNPDELLKQAAAIYNGIELDAFFHKLAEYNFVPQTQEEAEQYIRIAQGLSQLQMTQKVAASNTLLTHALNSVNQKLAEFGVTPPASPAVVDAEMQKFAMDAAAGYIENPVITQAMLTLLGAEQA